MKKNGKDNRILFNSWISKLICFRSVNCGMITTVLVAREMGVFSHSGSHLLPTKEFMIFAGTPNYSVGTAVCDPVTIVS